ncbi:hypothetical protein OAL67_00995 [bacterium]|nr:hypothetical protein [bacterium]
MDLKTKLLEEKNLKNTRVKVQEAKENLSETMNKVGAANLERLKELRENPETGFDFFLFLEQLNSKNVAFNIEDKYKILEEYEYLLKEPYFARIDLKDNQSNTLDELYIGKFGFSDERHSLVTDWRSKIASVYYRYRYPQKNVQYETPEGIQKKGSDFKKNI